MQAPVVLSLLLAIAAQGDRELVDRIVAVVNEDVILLSELKAASARFIDANATPERRKQVLDATMDNLIADKLMSQQVTEAKITVTSEDVDRAIQDILRQNEITMKDLEDAIDGRGMKMSKYRSDLESQIVRLKLVDLKVRSRVVVAEADIQAEYKRMTSAESREELLTLRHLFFRWGESPDPEEKTRVLTRADAGRARILKGEDFAVVAKEVSEGPTASSGGGLGELTRSGLLPELARAVSGLQVMQLSTPIETQNGVHVLRVDKIRKKDAPSYESQRNAIYQRMYQVEVERQMKVWIDELRAQSAIDVRQ